MLFPIRLNSFCKLKNKKQVKRCLSNSESSRPAVTATRAQKRSCRRRRSRNCLPEGVAKAQETKLQLEHASCWSQRNHCGARGNAPPPGNGREPPEHASSWSAGGAAAALNLLESRRQSCCHSVGANEAATRVRDPTSPCWWHQEFRIPHRCQQSTRDAGVQDPMLLQLECRSCCHQSSEPPAMGHKPKEVAAVPL
ncbi:hypothetical protein GHT09_016502 [Marmota monax]|uniref:Uncharacterized protein n=1 Tax=Marmota monax TaxID=9995 RepID=A0A834UV41_MARMO|nr:hypothetical protein GHT09_016502 [Marmota monax]